MDFSFLIAILRTLLQIHFSALDSFSPLLFAQFPHITSSYYCTHSQQLFGNHYVGSNCVVFGIFCIFGKRNGTKLCVLQQAASNKMLKLQFKMGSIPSCQLHADTTQVHALSQVPFLCFSDPSVLNGLKEEKKGGVFKKTGELLLKTDFKNYDEVQLLGSKIKTYEGCLKGVCIYVLPVLFLSHVFIFSN